MLMLQENNVTISRVEEDTSLIEHTLCVSIEQTVEAVYESFQKDHEREFVGVVNKGLFVGLVGRGQLGFLLGSRYGFALYARHPIAQHLIEKHSSFQQGTPILDILKIVLSRDESTFYDDVAMLDGTRRFLGLVSVQKLVRLQSQLINDQINLAESQKQSLESKNSQLFRSLHQLKQSQGTLGILFENSALGVALVNSRGEIESCNFHAQSLLGIQSAIGNDITINLTGLVLPKMRAEFTDQLQRHETAWQDRSHQQGEFMLELPNHGPRLFRMFTNWISETGQVCILLDDITEQRLLERRVAQEERSFLLESLAGGIAHEINNKLSPILGYTELLMERTTEMGASELTNYLSIIRDCATESSKIIGQLLQLSRPANAEKSLCDLSEICEQAAAIVKFQLRKVDAEVVLDFSGQKLGIVADAPQLKQVLINLLINAAHAVEGRDTRKITIAGEIVGMNLKLTVSDTGYGISKEHLKRIYDPFFTTKAPNHGTGLGLSVCFTIIEQHNGHLDIKSEVGEGTQITILLPRGAESKVAKSASPQVDGVAFVVAGRPRVLVVDDEDFVTSLIQESLRTHLNCHVERASNGLKAIEILHVSTFDLIISDVRMGGLDGFGLLEWVRKERPDMVSHFFLITGDAGSADLNHKMENLGVQILRKPFRMAQLLEMSSRLIRNPSGTENRVIK